MARIKSGPAYGGEAPPRQLAVKAARKSAPAYGGMVPARQLPYQALRKSAPTYEVVDHSEEGGSGEESGSAEEDDSAEENQMVVPTGAALRGMLFKKLLSALCSPSDEKYGTFAASEVIPPSQQGPILDSIHVLGAGELHLPLSIADVAKLRSVGGQSAFGCQVDFSKVTFPKTPEFISKTMQLWALKAVRELGRYGPAVQLEVRPDKLMLFDRDGRFKIYPGKEKAKGVYAKFVIQLPTQEGYKGGELVVHHRNSTKSFDWLNRISKIGFCYCVFFGDCKHELRRIISGTCVCLVFDLVKLDPSSDEALLQALISSKAREAEAALRPWVQDVMEGNQIFGKKLAIPLGHRYKERKLSFTGLKGDDKIVAEVLKSCRDTKGERLLDLHLCLLTKFQHGNYVEVEKDFDGSDLGSEFSFEDDAMDHVMDYVTEEIISIKGWIGLDEKQTMAFQKVEMDMEQEVVSEGRELFRAEPDSAKYFHEKYEAGPTLKHWYYRTIILVWPKDISSSLACETSVSGALDLLECRFQIGDPRFSVHLHQIVSYCVNNTCKVWKHGKERVYHDGKPVVRDDGKLDSVTPRLLQLCTKASMVDDVVLILKLLAKSNSTSEYRYVGRVAVSYKVGVRTAEVAKEIASTVKVFGWGLFSTAVVDLVKECGLTQGPSFAQLAKEFINLGSNDAAAIVIEKLVAVFEARCVELETHIADLEKHKEPKFTWCQPDAKLPSYPDVENFLKGPQKILKYECRSWILYSHAKSFADRYFRSNQISFHGTRGKDGYSATANVGVGRGTGSKPFCEIQKTRDIFDIAVSKWKRQQEELKPLRRQLEELKSFILQTEALAGKAPSNEAGKKRHRLDTEDSQSGPEVLKKRDKKSEKQAREFIDLTSDGDG